MSSNSNLQRLVDKIEGLHETIKERNAEKSEVYKDAKSAGYDVKALRKIIAIRPKGRETRRRGSDSRDLSGGTRIR